MERFSFIFLVAGIGFFVLAFVVSAWIPMLPVDDLEIATVEELAARVPIDFIELREQYPDAFKKAFGDKSDTEALTEALRIGHKTYIGEACWHCHSQQVRHWGNDEARFGRVSYPEEYHHELGMPPLWGTRRVGPDLARVGGLHSNDWHVAHFWKPTDVVPDSVYSHTVYGGRTPADRARETPEARHRAASAGGTPAGAGRPAATPHRSCRSGRTARPDASRARAAPS